jgi:hypothetical protein
VELRGLRAQLRETIEHYTARVDGTLASMITRMEGGQSTGEPPLVPPAKLSRAVVAELRELAIKPEKGRVKDLTRIKREVEDLATILESLG